MDDADVQDNEHTTKCTLKDDCLIINIKYEEVFHLEDSEYEEGS